MNKIHICIFLLLLLTCLFSIKCVIGANNNRISSKNSKNSKNTVYESMRKIPNAKKKWMRQSYCKTYMASTIYDALYDNLIEQTNNVDEADIIFPCDYNNIENEIRSLVHVQHVQHNRHTGNDGIYRQSKPKIVFIIEGADEITAKDRLWNNLVKRYGLDKASQISPMTYNLIGNDNIVDKKRLLTNHTEGKLYIMKKNIQRQQGLKITSSLEDIIKNEDKHVIVQEMIRDSYLIDGRKINLRVYIVVTCFEDKKEIFAYNDGFMYYTKKKYEYDDNSDDNHITTGYIERDVYVRNPLTLNDFRKYLDLPENTKYHPDGEIRTLSEVEKQIRTNGSKISEVVFERIYQMFKDIFICFNDCVCTDSLKQNITKDVTKNPIYSDYTIEIFGADVAIDSKLMPRIMEINKGPDLSPKDDRDAIVKHGLVSSAISIVGLSDKSTDKLHLIL